MVTLGDDHLILRGVAVLVEPEYLFSKCCGSENLFFAALQREYLFSTHYTIVENQGLNYLFIFYIVQTRLFIFIVCQARIFIYKNCQASPSESNGRPLTVKWEFYILANAYIVYPFYLKYMYSGFTMTIITLYVFVLSIYVMPLTKLLSILF